MIDMDVCTSIEIRRFAKRRHHGGVFECALAWRVVTADGFIATA